MAEQMLNDQQQQQQQEQQNQLQPYGVSFGTRSKARGIPYLPYVPVNIGAPNFRARQLPARPVREQQDVILPQDNMLGNQPMTHHNIQQQDNIAYDRRLYENLHSATGNDKWINQDSKDQWVFLNARDMFHRATEVNGYRLSVIFHTPQHLHRLTSEDWDALRESGIEFGN